MKRNFLLTSCLISLLLISGCASIISKSDYPVSFNSAPSGAQVTIKDAKAGRVIYKGKTPCIVTLKAKHGFFSPAQYDVCFNLPGYNTKLVTLDATLDGWYIGNIIFGGLIGFLIVDPATGAMWKLPSNIDITLTKKDIISMMYENRELKTILTMTYQNIR